MTWKGPTYGHVMVLLNRLLICGTSGAIHTIIGQCSFPRRFCMLPDKRSGTYSRLFSIIKEIRPKNLPNLCIMDFETTIHAAYLYIFPQSSVGACLFHLGQACWRKICALGDLLKYNTDAIFSLKMKYFQARSYCIRRIDRR